MLNGFQTTRLFTVAGWLLAVAALDACSRPETNGERGATARAESAARGSSSPSRLPAAESIQRAVIYLSGEVARWRGDNGCFSCHNNGDAARALMAAKRQGFAVRDGVLEETLAFITSPGSWDENSKGDPAASDLDLARVQFAAALVTAIELDYARDAESITRAARLVAPLQAPGGAWHLGPRDRVGSPTTYGRYLGTHMALRTLRRSGGETFAEGIARAESWLRNAPARAVLDAAALLMELGAARDPEAARQREASLDLLRRAQATSGGWGPYDGAPPEVFDTAVVLIALDGLDGLDGLEGLEARRMVDRGVSFLLSMQEPGGGWPETTRPPGSESYAQHISTTGWATLALLETRRAMRE